MLALSQVWLAIYLLPGCGKKKKEETKPPPKYKMSDPAATSPANRTDPKDVKSTDDKKGKSGDNKASSEDKKGTDPKKDGAAKPPAGDKIGAPVEKAPAKDAIIPALNKDHLVPQVKDAQQTVRPGGGGGDKDKVVSNPIVSAVTEQFPTVAEPPKPQEMQLDKTQGSEHTDKTQKD
uniref:Lipoprotein n=1 Tax=Panagrellus redivivus TaxID=6233 RepID=A0A7E4ZYV6_PANRE